MTELHKGYDRIIVSKDVQEKLSELSGGTGDNFSFYGIPVYVSPLLPENMIIKCEKGAFDLKYEPMLFYMTDRMRWIKLISDAIEYCINRYKFQLQVLKEQMFYQLDKMGEPLRISYPNNPYTFSYPSVKMLLTQAITDKGE